MSQHTSPTDEELKIWMKDFDLPTENHFKIPRLITEIRNLRATIKMVNWLKGLEIKQLKWVDSPTKSAAIEPFGAWYFVNEVSGMGWQTVYGEKNGSYYATREMAKLAAQAQYETNIMSVFSNV